MTRQRTRINRRANQRQDRAPEQRQVFPRGAVPGNGVQSRRSRVEEVVERSIPVEDATLPGARGRRSSMLPTDGMVAALQDGFSGVNDRLDLFIKVTRQAHGLDAADEELAQLRDENVKLTSELEVLQIRLIALTVQNENANSDRSAAQEGRPQVVASPAPAEAPETPTPPEQESEAADEQATEDSAP